MVFFFLKKIVQIIRLETPSIGQHRIKNKKNIQKKINCHKKKLTKKIDFSKKKK